MFRQQLLSSSNCCLLFSARGRHQKEVKAQEGHKYTRSSRKQSEQNKSAITDHVNQENRVINWNEAKIIARESDKTTRWIREAVNIRQESQGVMNRDEGVYQLSHVYDNLLFSMATSGGEQQTAVRGRQQLLSKRPWKFSELLAVVLRF